MLATTDDHRALAEVARSLLSDRGGVAAAHAALDGSPELPEFWKDIVGLGWIGLHIAERHGGQGFGLAELVVVAEELGRVVAPGPFLPTVVLAAAVSAVGTDEQQAAWLPSLVDGSRLAALGLHGHLAMRQATLDGDAGPVLGAGRADVLALVDGDDLVLVDPSDPGVEVATPGGLDPSRPSSALRCRAAGVLAVIEGGGAPARRVARIVAAAEAVGGMAAVTELSVAYAHDRVQFGRPIGGFMAVKHHLVDMLAHTELAAAATWDAARPTATEQEADLVAATATARATAGYRTAAALAVQVHGGIGYTWEHETNLHMRRAASLAALLDGPGAPLDDVVRLQRAGVRRVTAFDLPAEAEAHRAEARAFAADLAACPEADRQRVFARSGYLVPHWPAPYGRGADPLEQLVIEEELDGVERPSLGLGEWLIPTLLQHGTSEQVDRWMWPSLEGVHRWCQLFSEPGAGSDAAAVTTRAVKVDGGWSITGQKVWTSEAHVCDLGLATVRTNPDVPKHKGLSMVLIDMAAPGVEVRPLRELTGEHLFNEVFLDDVFIPDDHVIGEVDDGWRVARAALGNERVTIGGGSTSMVASELLDLLERHRPDDPVAARQVAELLVEAHALRMLNLRSAVRLVEAAGPGAEGSLGKLVGAEHAQRVVDCGLELIGPAALLGGEPQLERDYFYTRCLTIAGGTSEVLRSQIGELVLGLPREPRGA
jgi:alkylation response protein AidB-like acyl-CoA dehydrogenase